LICIVSRRSCSKRLLLMITTLYIISQTDSDLTFDPETAIQVCRQAGYYEHAVYLAEKFEEHDLYVLR